MMKKILALAGTGALLLSVAGPAFGWYLFSKDVAIVDNSATAIADTGGNSQSNIAQADDFSGATTYGGSGARTMYTGDADAHAGALVVANTHVGCDGCGFEGVYHKDFAKVDNFAGAGAYTGDNDQDDVAFADDYSDATTYGSSGGRHLDTGDADSTARAWVIVNTHWTD